MPEIPHLAWPIQFKGTGLAAVEQDTVDEVAVCVAVIVAFPVGFRVEAPEFGVPDPEFRPFGKTYDDALEAIGTYEPRATVTLTEGSYDTGDPTTSDVRLEVSVVAGEDSLVIGEEN